MSFLQNLNGLDYTLTTIIIIVSLLASLKGVVRNLINILMLLFSYIFASFLAKKLYDVVINKKIPNDSLGYAVSFVLVIIIAYIVLNLFFKFVIRDSKEKVCIKCMIIGFILCAIKYFLIFSIAFSSLYTIKIFRNAKLVEDSQITPALVKTGDLLYSPNININMDLNKYKDDYQSLTDLDKFNNNLTTPAKVKRDVERYHEKQKNAIESSSSGYVNKEAI